MTGAPGPNGERSTKVDVRHVRPVQPLRLEVGVVFGLVLAALSPSAALADEAEGTTGILGTVHLRGGEVLRARITEIVPGDHVTVLTVGGEPRRVAWGAVERVVVPSDEAPSPTIAASSATAAPMSGPRARVHINAPRPSYLHRRAAGTSEFVSACETPCDAEMPLGDTYKIGGSGFTTTREFKLDAAPGGSVVLTVDGPSWPGIVGGSAVAVVGAAAGYAGVWLLALAGVGCSAGSSPDCTTLRNVGLGGLGLGVGMIALGLAVFIPSLKTDLSQQKGGPSKDAFIRAPTWRPGTWGSEAGPPASFALVYQGRF